MGGIEKKVDAICICSEQIDDDKKDNHDAFLVHQHDGSNRQERECKDYIMVIERGQGKIQH
jgi:hypothetical protein